MGMMLYITIGMLLAFLLGYIWGKHRGWLAGCSETEAAIPLKLRQQSLEQGKCVICDECWMKLVGDNNNSRDLGTL